MPLLPPEDAPDEAPLLMPELAPELVPDELPPLELPLPELPLDELPLVLIPELDIPLEPDPELLPLLLHGMESDDPLLESDGVSVPDVREYRESFVVTQVRVGVPPGPVV
jgi:hypothetical protein